jgi:phosphoadenosine phosphosulfate reductase
LIRDNGRTPVTAVAAQTPDDVAMAASALAGATPLEVLAWAAERYAPRLGFATGFGAEGCVLIDLIGRHHLAIDIFTLDTGVLFPETYALWRRLETKYRITIRGVQPAQTLAEQAATLGDALWEREPDRCCRLRKIEPLAREAGKLDAWIAAIRRDQTPERATAQVVERDAKFGLVKVNPLVAWTTRDVWAYLLDNGVPYNPLHDLGYPSIGCQPCTSPVADGEDPRAGRWRGSDKRECGLHAPDTLVRRAPPEEPVGPVAPRKAPPPWSP